MFCPVFFLREEARERGGKNEESFLLSLRFVRRREQRRKSQREEEGTFLLFPPPLSTFQFQFQSLEHPLPSRKSSPGSLPRSIAKWYRKQDGEIVFFFSLLSFFPSGNDFLSFAPHSHPLLDSLISTPCMRRGSRRDLWELLRVIKRKKRRRKGGAKVVLLSIACEASVFSDRFFFFFVLSHKKRKLFSFQKKKNTLSPTRSSSTSSASPQTPAPLPTTLARPKPPTAASPASKRA